MVDDKGRARHELIADAPNQLWLSEITEITEHCTGEGELHLGL